MDENKIEGQDEIQTKPQSGAADQTMLGGVDGYDLDSIISIEKEITKLQSIKADKLKLWADNNCPYKIDDVIDILGYVHTGGKGRITFINGIFKTHVYDKSNSLGWYVKGIVLKKDGSDSQNYFDFDDWHYNSKRRK